MNMNLSGDMPKVGFGRFGLVQEKPEAVRVSVNVPVQGGYAKGGVVPRPAPAQQSAAAPAVAATGVPAPAAPSYLSATKKPLRVGQTVRGSDRTKNENVDSDFRGTILEFIPPTPGGNNVRVRCQNTGKVYRVHCSEIRNAQD